MTSLQPLRSYREPFSQCNYVRIPAIAHRFYTTQLLLQAYTNASPCQRIEPVFHIDSQTFLVEVIFVVIWWNPVTNDWLEYLMPPQSGTVVIASY